MAGGALPLSLGRLVRYGDTVGTATETPLTLSELPIAVPT